VNRFILHFGDQLKSPVCVYVCVYRFIRHNGEITYIVCVCLSVHVHVCVCVHIDKDFETLNGTVWMQQLKVRGHCEEIIKEDKKTVVLVISCADTYSQQKQQFRSGVDLKHLNA